jgi:hypothetical protein
MRALARCGLSALLLVSTLGITGTAHSAQTLNDHPVVQDSGGRLLAWVTPQGDAYGSVVQLAFRFLADRVPAARNGLPAYYSHSYLDKYTLQPADWPHNPAGLNAMLTESLLGYYAYSGDATAIDLSRRVVDYHLANGLTPSDWAWPGVPFASADAGATEYRGARMGDRSGRGDGYGAIEPDKVGELGYALIRLYEQTGDVRYRDAAVAWADVLVRHQRDGDADRSPWPFRVSARDGEVREEYTANTIAPIKLFDELIRLGMGDSIGYERARQRAWAWLMEYPMRTNAWANYFEDVELSGGKNNVNQLVAVETARYLLQNPQRDPNWHSDVTKILQWTERTFGRDEFGATSIAEQSVFSHPMGSHTARYASVNALLYAQTGDASAREEAFRSFNWATYMTLADGRVIDGPEVNQIWFTDGYGDYIRHLLAGMAAVPEWAPPGQDHLLGSSSVVRSASYRTGDVQYTTSDAAGTEVLRLSFVPSGVTLDGQPLNQLADLAQVGYTFDPALGTLRIRREGGTHVAVVGSTPIAAPAAPVEAALPPLPMDPGVNFNDLPIANQPLLGQYPAGVIDWGNGDWYLSLPWKRLITNSVSFNGPGLIRATFTLPTPRRLVQLDAYNGGGQTTTITVACAGQADKQTALGADERITISTDFVGPCTSVTVGSTNGWDTNFDNFVLE